MPEEKRARALPADGVVRAEAGATSALKTPEQWRDIAYKADKRGRQHASVWQHNAASAVHGWAEHAHHEGAPMLLTGEDYYAALVAASQPDEKGNYVPHRAALSKHAPSAKGHS